jgi:molecular chaperone GrpE
MQEETDSYPDNTVIEELRRGYYFKDRLLRPALVKVARAVSKQENNQ